MDKISIIVPVYNTEEYISRCIESLISQSYNHLEIILINDGSTDNSGKICDKYALIDKRIKVIHQNNEGQSSARNVGLDLATGDYIGFVDSDDWIDKNMYEYLIQLIKSTDSDIANIDYMCVNGKKEIKPRQIKNKIYYDKDILQEYLYEGTIRGSYSFCRNLYKKCLFDNERFPIGKINEDIVTNYKVMNHAKKMVKSNYLGYYYFQNKNSTTNGGLKKRDFDLLEVSTELVNLTNLESYGNIKYLSEIKLARSYFSLLAKIVIYGIEDDDIDKSEVIKYLTKKIRQNYIILLKSPIPISRKLMITILCINNKCLSIPISIYRHMRRIVKYGKS